MEESHVMDTATFKNFAPLLDACQEYATISGFRFKANFLVKDEASQTEEIPKSSELSRRSSQTVQIKALAQKAAPVVNDFTQRLQAGEAGLAEELERALWITRSEGYRSAILVSLRELDLWPPTPPPEGIGTDDCAYEDVAAPLETIAQRAYNDEMRRIRDEKGGFCRPRRTAQTASFLLDFADVVGDAPPLLVESSDRHQELLDEFLMRVAEWHNGQQDCGFSPSFFQRLQLETAAGRLKIELEKVAASNLLPKTLNCRENVALTDDGTEICFATRGCCEQRDNGLPRRLQIEVLAASNLGPPEYRVGDSVSGILGTASLRRPYAEISLGKLKQKTKCGEGVGRRSKNACGEGFAGDAVIFKNEIMTFPFQGEDACSVRLYDERKIQALMRGDPLIGGATLQLDSGLDDGLTRSIDLEISRAEQSAGKISLQYQLLPSINAEITVPSATDAITVPVLNDRSQSTANEAPDSCRRRQAI